MQNLYEKGRDNPPIAKNMPPKAGAIGWARSITGRIKSPINKFKTREGMLHKDNGRIITTKYVALAKTLEKDYQTTIYERWVKDNTELAIKLLSYKILASKKGGKGSSNTYVVNFAPELKVIIREAKYLDRLGMAIPQTIINIAL